MSKPHKLLAVCAGLCLIIGTVFAQVKSSAITGAVTDPSGAIVPKASITVQNEETNVTAETQTNDTGDYTVPYLPSGRYTLVVKANVSKPTAKPASPWAPRPLCARMQSCDGEGRCRR